MSNDGGKFLAGEIVMYKKVLSLLLSVSLSVFGGCLTDISGWDLSACDGEFDTCYELFRDNQEKILDGDTIIDFALDIYNARDIPSSG